VLDRPRRQARAALIGRQADERARCAARRRAEDGLVPDLLATVARGVARGPGEGATRERGTRAADPGEADVAGAQRRRAARSGERWQIGIPLRSPDARDERIRGGE